MYKYNFNAGPAILPKEVLKIVQQDLLNWKNCGFSILEISHRSEKFLEFVYESEKNIRDILNIPKNYKILFCQGGARGQFAAIPINFSKKKCSPEYINSGFWSFCASEEAKKFCIPKIINVYEKKYEKIKKILSMKKWVLNSQKNFLHYCPNETIDGIEIFEEPNFLNKFVIGDFSSTLLTRTIDVSKYSMIYACAQKNIGPAGLTIVIIEKNFLETKNFNVPSIFDYKILSNSSSLFNTPPVFSWYVSGLVFQWIKKIGGIKKIEKINLEKSKTLYKYINSTDFYINNVHPSNRSRINVPFFLYDKNLTQKFLKLSEEWGLLGLKGHSIIGGIRASLYNAMPLNGIKYLIKFMKFFEKRFG